MFLVACNSSSKLQNKSVEDIEDFNLLLQKVRLQYKMPAMAAAVIKSDAIQAIGVTGIRRIHEKTKVLLSDRFHLGSNDQSHYSTLGSSYGRKRNDSLGYQNLGHLSPLER